MEKLYWNQAANVSATNKTVEQYDDEINALCANPATSYWLRETLAMSCRRDPLDMLADVEQLYSLLSGRVQALLRAGSAPKQPEAQC